MKKLAIPFLIFSLAAIIGHWGALKLTPTVIMGKAMHQMNDKGMPFHRFVPSQRITPQTQTVVRPSPDLAYSICLYDFSIIDVPLEIHAGFWKDYGSISFFDEHTNNFATVRIDAKVSKILLSPHGMALPSNRKNGMQYIETPTPRGLILIRRLAPTSQAYDRVSQLANTDKCQPMFDL